MLILAGKNWVRNWFLRIGWIRQQRTPLRRLPGRRSQRGESSIPLAAMVETLETRVLLTGIVVTSTDGGANYASTVTINQLDPTHLAVTLRDAVNAANNTAGADTISFDPGVFPAGTLKTITLGGTALELKEAVTISGPGAGQVAVSGNDLSTVFIVDGGVTAEIDGLMITGGHGSFGGGVSNAGTLVLEDDAITANSATANGGGIFNSGGLTVAGCTLAGNSSAANGGGLANVGTVSVSESTFTDNHAAGDGGGFFNFGNVALTASTLANNSAPSGGGFWNFGNVTVTNSTLADNNATDDAGGFFNFGSVTVVESTLARNTAPSGGGVFNGAGNVTLQGTILALNTVSPASSTPSDWAGAVATAASGFNLIGDGTNTGLTDGVSGNIVGTPRSLVNPLLGPLASNGGPTQTLALLPGSRAIDAAGSNLPVDPLTKASLTTDQRGFSRLVGGMVDIGAFELEASTPVVTTITAPTVTYGEDGQVTVAVDPSSATGTLSLFVDGSSTAVGTHTLLPGDNGSFTFDVGILNAGTHTLHAEYDATGTFLSSTADGSLVVNKADATIHVTGYSVTYDGNTHTATGTATGVGGADLSAGLNLSGTTHTSAGTYAGDSWTFSGGTNYNDASGTVDDSIARADATIKVTGFNGTYDGLYHGATGTATGVGGTDLSAQLSLGATFRNVPGGTAHWTFNGGTNYNDASGNVSIVIGVRMVTGVVTANDKVYDGTTTATISSTSLANAVAGDDVSLTVGAASFASPNAGTWPVTATGLSLAGADAGNYVLTETTAQTTATIEPRSLSAVLSTASTINIARNGTITFTLSSLSGIVDGQTVADLFNGVQFTLVVGSNEYSGTSTTSVVDGTIYVSLQMTAALYTDLSYLLSETTTPSSKTTITLTLYATSADGNYTLSSDVLTRIFQQGNVTFS